MNKIISKGRNLLQQLKGSPDEVISKGVTFINEAINHEKQCVFIAIPKTGTSTIRVQLRNEGQPLIPNAHLDIQQIRHLFYFDKLRNNLGRNRAFPSQESVLSNSDIAAGAEDDFQSFFKFSAVRNPWARAVSLYFRNEGINVKDSMSFREFCEQHIYASDTCYHPSLHKNQFDWLCDSDGKLLMDYIYRTEDFEKAIIDIRERTEGRIELKNIKQNMNPNSRSSDYRNMYTEETKKLIQVRYEKDIDMFKFKY